MRFLFLAAALLASLAAQNAITPAPGAAAPGKTVQFSSTVPSVWSIAPQVGQICASGLYIAPASMVAAQFLTVTASTAAGSTSTYLVLSPGSSTAPLAACPAVANAAQRAPWMWQEIPTGSVDATQPGTGYVLTLKCAAAPGTIHLWMGSQLLFGGTPADVGAVQPVGYYYVQPADAHKLSAIDFNFSDPMFAPCGAGACGIFRVDYQYIPDASGNCP